MPVYYPLYRLLDGLLVRNLGDFQVHLYTELALELLDNGLQVDLTHTRDDNLPGLLVPVQPEGGIFLQQPGNGSKYLILVLLGLGLRKFSMNPIFIPRIKNVLRSVEHKTAEEVVQEALMLKTAQEIEECVIERILFKHPKAFLMEL